ncbi:MAG: phenylalanine--tRNA ligase subunit beta, partial [Bacteroidia bacterium]|nr:phenylalanine--tRNA ligase subunit beta [Bacteroidia bacterium]
LYSGLESIRHNINRQANDLKFFEFGKSYNKQKNHFIETPHLALFTTGKKHKINIHSKNIDGKIYYLKACVKNILDCLGLNYHESYTGKYTLLNQYIEYQNSENKILAIIGQVEKKALQVFDIDQEVFYGELDWQLLMQELKNKSIEYAPVPKFPAVRRDLALLIDKDIPFADIKKIAINIDNEIIKSVDLFDIYEGKQIPEGKKSYAISIVLQNNNKTLTDAEVDQVIDKLVIRYSKEINAEIR